MYEIIGCESSLGVAVLNDSLGYDTIVYGTAEDSSIVNCACRII